MPCWDQCRITASRPRPGRRVLAACGAVRRRAAPAAAQCERTGESEGWVHWVGSRALGRQQPARPAGGPVGEFAVGRSRCWGLRQQRAFVCQAVMRPAGGAGRRRRQAHECAPGMDCLCLLFTLAKAYNETIMVALCY